MKKYVSLFRSKQIQLVILFQDPAKSTYCLELYPQALNRFSNSCQPQIEVCVSLNLPVEMFKETTQKMKIYDFSLVSLVALRLRWLRLVYFFKL